jgi:uncharacterized RDD family membrane protein YckC
MFCSKCGTAQPDNAAFCGACGNPLGTSLIPSGKPVPNTAPASFGSVPAPSIVAVPTHSPYAGFWLRFVAYVIDALLCGLIFTVFALILVAIIGVGTLRGSNETFNSPESYFAAPAAILFFCAILTVAIFGSWLYYALLESSTHQGTLGKISLGLIVTDLEGRRITFARASGRFFAKIITGLIPLCIGYIMAGFTAKKQALHDMIASCLVLKKT